MNFRPNRLLGMLLGTGGLSALLIAIGLSLARLGQGLISPGSLIWIVALLLALPLTLLVGYRLLGLATASYRVDRDGLYVRWGLVYEQIPIASVVFIEPASKLGGAQRPALGVWWPGCLVGRGRTDQNQELVFFAGSGEQLIVSTCDGRFLVLSPPDSTAFQGAFLSATRMGALEKIAERSDRPDFLLTRIWKDRAARGLILAGLGLPLLGLTVLVLKAPGLPEQIPFGFGPGGEPGPLAPPGRLLLLPLIAGLAWLVDLVLGSWFYRSLSERPLSYALWGASVVAGALLGGAALYLTSTAVR
ncbi:MAG TPA: PH domain-containing protein [Anaerolineales bacterium]